MSMISDLFLRREKETKQTVTVANPPVSNILDEFVVIETNGNSAYNGNDYGFCLFT